jgi:hypothetical protein
VAAAWAFLVLGAVGFLPLFGGPGYEQSLASGLCVPAAAAVAAALGSLRSEATPLACLGRAMGGGLFLAAVAFATALLHGARVGICDLSAGSIFFVLTAGVGAVMGGAWGAVVAELCRGRRRSRVWCVLLAIAAPAAGVVVSVARFYFSPMIFSYDPFFGFFSGTLYDTIVDERPELWTYRAGSLAALAGAALVASVFVRTPGGTIALGRLRGDSGACVRAALGLIAAAAAAAVFVNGPALGHWQTAGSIARALGGRAAGPRCDVYYPESLLADEVDLLVRDCEEEVSAVERRLGAPPTGRLTAFVFRDGSEKRALTGAAQTSVAKPWRREVYVQMAGYPHPILGHEIAHVVAGGFGRGPFRIAGGAGGLWPNPGLIEGIAVAASPDDDELTDGQWARAMLDLGTLPPLEGLFSFGFLGENAAKSYTVAGAFVTWVLGRWGNGVVRAWYGGGSLEQLTGRSWSALEGEFRESLRTLAMPAGASAYASARFERPSVWARKCPHVVDALNGEGDRCRDEHRLARANGFYERVLLRDPRDWHARFERARIETWYRDEPRGRAELTAIAADERAPRTWRDRAEELLADDDLAHGRSERAEAAYRTLAAGTLDEDSARTLEVKASAGAGEEARRAVVDLLIGDPGRPGDPWLGALSLGVWAARDEPLGAYLVGKNLALRGRYARAAVWLDRALAAGVAIPSVGREMLRQRAICACALGDAAAIAHTKASVKAADSPFAAGPGEGRRDSVLRLIDRCGDWQPSGSP